MSDSVRNIRANVYLNDKTAGKSLRKLSDEARKLNHQLRNMDTNSKEYQETLAKLQGKKRLLREHHSQLRTVDKGWGNVANKFNKYFTLVSAGLATLTGVLLGFREQITALADLSDLRADVQKVTDLTQKEMDALQQRFDSMNTRTPRKELLGLAVQAGKMGERGVDAISKFVEQANELNVAIGDELGDDATLKIGKMADVFDTSIRKIGSGINAVADSTKAGAGFLTEFASRLAGISKEVNISAGDVLGYGATLDELGLKVEMSSTALNGFFVDFTKNTEKFGQVAGFANGELSNLIGEEGTNKGFLAFLQRMRESSATSEDFLKKLEAVGISGDRKAQTFLALSQNVDKLRDRQALANEEIEKGTSLTNEYNRKNENFAANLAKIGRKLHAVFINSTALQFVDRLAGRLVKLINTEETRADALRKVNAEAQRELEILKLGNFSQKERSRLVKEINDNYGEYLPNLLDEKAGIEDIAKAQKALNEEMTRRILIAEMEDEISKLTKTQIAAADAALQQKKALAELNTAQERDATPQQIADRRGLLKSLVRINEEAIENAGKAEQEIREKYKAIAETLNVALSAGGSGSGTNNKPTEEEIDARKDAAKKINTLLDKQNQTEIDKVRAKWDKVLALAEEYGIKEQEVRQAADEELRKLSLEQEQEAREEEQARKMELMQSSLEQLHTMELDKLRDHKEFKEASKEEQQEMELQAEIRHLERLLKARKTLGEDTAKVEQDLHDKKQALRDAETEEAKERQKEAAVHNASMAAFSAAATAESADDAAKAVLNSIRRTMQGLLAEAVAKAIVSSIGKGPLGLILAPLAAGAAGALFNSLVPKFNVGGFTDTTGLPDPDVPGRKIAGVVHDREYVVAEEELQNPNTAWMVSEIEKARRARRGGFASGGATGSSGQQLVQTTTNNTQSIQLDSLEAVVMRLSGTLQRLERNGIPAIADDRFERDMKEKRERDTRITDNSRI